MLLANRLKTKFKETTQSASPPPNGSPTNSSMVTASSYRKSFAPYYCFNGGIINTGAYDIWSPNTPA